MLKLFNSLGKKLETFTPASNEAVTVFTCGPSIYQRAHIGNFRTFLFEDILVRYLTFLGYRVKRGMNFTDIEDKAIVEARKQDLTVRELTDRNIDEFIGEMKLLGIRIPEYLPRSSDYANEAAGIAAKLIELGIAYRHGDNIYFDPLKFPGFGKLYGLDMGRWPAKRRRFHLDTYPGIQWNLGDFILWHGCGRDEALCWDTPIGRGRPSWNIQDPSMVASRFQETLSIYCGGIDNLYRHHDYSIAILESIRPYPMARYWLHGAHLFVGGKKMSKSRGNILYAGSLLDSGYSAAEIRFFLVDGPYREKLSYTGEAMDASARRLRRLRQLVCGIAERAELAGRAEPQADGRAARIRETFRAAMDDDLAVRRAIAGVRQEVEAAAAADLPPRALVALVAALREIDTVLNVLF
jgi:cysteinyl-tRNA synthetase